MVRVGIPRSLGYFYLFPLYRAFFDELGIPYVESPFTSEADLQNLDLCPTDEPCIAVKAAFTHVDRLLKMGVDAIFVPAVISLGHSAYCCPKMMGLPAMLKGAFDLPDEAFVSPVIDYRDDSRGWPKTWLSAARQMGVSDTAKARKALDRGIRAWKAHEAVCVQEGISSGDVLRGAGVTAPGRVLRGAAGSSKQGFEAPATAVMSHSYVLHDVFAKRVLDVVRAYGPAITAENVGVTEATSALLDIFESEKLWSIEGHILGAALHLIRAGKVSRLIFVSAFSCGPASIIENYIAKEADALGVPLLNLAVDEHSGEAGLLTRLEAFMDSTSAATRMSARVRTERKVTHGGSSREAVAPPAPRHRERGPIGLVDMGNLRYSLRSLFLEMGCDFVMPPPLTEDIVRLGKEIAPEFICYPMVTLIGQMRKHAENGIKKIAMVQGKGRCRLGWYAQVMEEILQKSGYPVRVLSIDSPLPLPKKWGSFVESYRALSEGAPFPKGLRGLRMALVKIAAADRAGDILRDTRAYEAERGEGDRRYATFLHEMDCARTVKEVWAVFRDYERDMRAIPRIEANPLQVAVVGEVYVVNEPFVNKDAERILGSLEQRVRVYRTLDVNSWVDYHLFRKPRAVRQYNTVSRSASPYLPVNVGGHGQESVGEAVLAKKHGMDGVVHLFPFTCMPEIIAQNILVKVSRDLDIPVLSLMISEQTGVAGLQTRFEAFCDLLEGRRKQKTVNES